MRALLFVLIGAFCATPAMAEKTCTDRCVEKGLSCYDDAYKTHGDCVRKCLKGPEDKFATCQTTCASDKEAALESCKTKTGKCQQGCPKG